MKLFKSLVISIAAVSALGSTAMAECFYSRSASGFEVIDDETLQVRVGVRDYYDLSMRFCSSLRWADKIAFRSHSSWVCDGDEVILLDYWDRVVDRCWIDQITKHDRQSD